MQLKPETLNILQNFATINQNLKVSAGNVLRTISSERTVLAIAKIEDTFPVDFCIYDLSRFLKVLSLFEKPSLNFKDKYVEVVSGKNSIKYVYAEPSIIQSPPDKDLKDLDGVVQFKLSFALLEKVLKVGGVLGIDDITFFGKGGKLYIKAHDKKNDSSDEYVFEVEGATVNKDFTFDFLASNFRLMAGDYDVVIAEKKFSTFTGGNLKYYIATEETSKY